MDGQTDNSIMPMVNHTVQSAKTEGSGNKCVVCVVSGNSPWVARWRAGSETVHSETWCYQWGGAASPVWRRQLPDRCSGRSRLRRPDGDTSQLSRCLLYYRTASDDTKSVRDVVVSLYTRDSCTTRTSNQHNQHGTQKGQLNDTIGHVVLVLLLVDKPKTQLSVSLAHVSMCCGLRKQNCYGVMPFGPLEPLERPW